MDFSEKFAELDCIRSSFPRPDPDHIFYIEHENFPVADATGTRGLENRLHCRLDLIRQEDDLDFDLGQEVNDILGAAVQLGVAFLAAEPLRLGDGDPLDTDLMKRLFHLVKLE